jgi:transmembrane sensor
MINNPEHIENNPEFSPDLIKLISGSRITWSKTSEEIWPELLSRIDRKALSEGKGKTVYMHVYHYVAAASVAVILLASSLLYGFTKTVNTSSGRAYIILPDNSRVDVYPGSVLKYKPLIWKLSRSVKLQGEAFFKVQSGRKFEVLSSKGKTIVQGTKFDVFARNNEYNVTCETGRVKVVEFSRKNEVVISGGQKALLQSDGHFKIEEIRKSDLLETISQTKTENHELNPVINPVAEKRRFEKNENKKIPDENHAGGLKEEVKTDNVKIQVQSEKVEQHSENQLLDLPQGNPQINLASDSQEKYKDDGQSNGSESDAGQRQSTGSQARERFRSSLTQEQLCILQNQEMTNEEKRNAFMRSLSPEQNQLLRDQTMERGRQGMESVGMQSDNGGIKNQLKGNVRDEINTKSTLENKGQQTNQNQGNGDNSRH